MWHHGRKIINALFKKRTTSPAIRVELESKIQADSDRSDIRVFEAPLSAERYGDYEQSTGVAAQEEESRRIINIAKSKGLFIPKSDWQQFGDRKRLPSGESIVFLNEQETVITKIRDPFAKAVIKSLHVQDAIYEHLIHNILFPTTHYSFIGISEDFDGVRMILQQKYFSRYFLTPTQKSINEYLMSGLGLHLEDRYYYANDYFAVTDVSADGDNVLTDERNLYFIDPIIKFKKPAVEVLEHYYKLLK